MATYGLPYQGSKNRICKEIVELLPAGGVFYDVFAGGCAVSHCAIESNKWDSYVVNDIQGDVVQLFYDVITGKFEPDYRWIDRETFQKEKDTNAFIRLCWSFGNGGVTYLYSEEIEPWKQALHYARVFNDFSLFKTFGIETDGSRSDIIENQDEYKSKYVDWYCSNVLHCSPLDVDEITKELNESKEKGRLYLVDCLKKSGLKQSEVNRRLGTQMSRHYFGRSQWTFPTEEEYNKMREFMPLKPYSDICGEVYKRSKILQILSSLKRLNNSDRLYSLPNLEILTRLSKLKCFSKANLIEAFSVDYHELDLSKKGVIYCDPPYKDTAGYGMEFNHNRFYDWCEQQANLVFISEYYMPEDRFVKIWNKPVQKLMSPVKKSYAIEGLYIPKKQHELYLKTIRSDGLFEV